jgi:hypothetical protein
MLPTRLLLSRRTWYWLAAVVPISVVACSSEAPPTSAPKTTYNYLIDFQSKDAAVSVDTLIIQVFEAQSSCSSLTLKRTSGGDLPKPVGQVGPVDVCDVLTNKGGLVTVPYGSFSILVVARRGDKDWFIGCATQRVDVQTGEPPVITLTNFDNTVTVSPTSCPSVSAHCRKEC